MMPIWLRTIVVLLVQMLFTSLVLMGLGDNVPNWWWALCLGVLASQLTALPTFAALAHWRIGMLRLPTTLFLLALIWLMFVIWLRVAGWFIPQIAMIWAAAAIWGYAIVFGGVRLVSWLSRWQLAIAKSTGGEIELGQFRIAHMLAATAGTAILLGLGRVVLLNDDWTMPPILFWNLLIGAGIMAMWVVVNTTIVMPVSLWGSSLKGGALAAFALVAPLCAVLATLLESVVLNLLDESAPDTFPNLLAFNLAQVSCLVASFKMLHWAGWRLRRVPELATCTSGSQTTPHGVDDQPRREGPSPESN